MYAQEERKLLLQAAAEINSLLSEHNKSLNKVINHLISAADELKLTAADEVTQGLIPKVKVIKYGQKQTPENNPAVTLAEGKRACSMCRKPGHRAANCPEAHIFQQAKKDAVAARDSKPARKPRKPMSPERKAQLIVTLAKARAARGKKK